MKQGGRTKPSRKSASFGNSKSNPEWRGFDTETANGKAVLVATDRKALAFPKSFPHIAEFLMGEGRKFSAYNMDYDARAIMLFLPKRVLTRLHYDTSVTYRGYRIKYLPRKIFTISKDKETLSIYDVHQFYGGRLADTAGKVGMSKMDCPKNWYWRMDWALRTHKAAVILYCMNDAAIAKALMDRLYKSLNEFVRCEEPYSPAAVARCYFGGRLKFSEPRWVHQLFQRSFRGGRIEVYRRGWTGPGILYDIRSAYPFALSQAQDPRACTLVRTNGYRNDAAYGAYRIECEIDGEEPIPPLAYTAKIGGRETTIFPKGKMELIVDRESLSSLRDVELFRYKILESWEYLINEKKLLFPEIGELYARRRREPELDLAIKLVLNGLYGIMCQEIGVYIRPEWIDETSRRIGDEWRMRVDRISNTTHYAVAAFVTGSTRRRVWDLMRQNPDDVLFCATDGVAVSKPRPFLAPVLGESLGDWSIAKEFSESIIVGSGVYSLKTAKGWEDKMRGLPVEKKLVEMLDCSRSKLSASVTNVDTLADAVRESQAQMNVIRKVKRTFDLNFDQKRVWPHPWKRGRELLQGFQRS